ncbi:AraC family transcriptional regulator [Arthrobacter sp. LAPM80]|uniref:helix-turn-helix domain-containing protein n=1 Tax=Arthrobacter sp. LAPM80 TaxID=3141788 RepID=UPI00398AEF65
MRSVQSAQASPALRPFVRAFAQRTLTDTFQAQPMPAFLETVLHFDFNDVLTIQSADGSCEAGSPMSLVGPHTHTCTSLLFQGTIDSFAIFLEPTALWPLFRVPISTIVDTFYDSTDVLGASLSTLWNVLAETTNFLDRIRISETFLLRQLALERGAATIATTAGSLLTRRAGRITIVDLASHVNVSVRELERLFIQDMGITPKRFARVARFQAALDAKVGSPDKSWLDIAVNAGYHDQMHLIHEFESFCGFSPTLTMGRLGDSRPQALASSHD